MRDVSPDGYETPPPSSNKSERLSLSYSPSKGENLSYYPRQQTFLERTASAWKKLRFSRFSERDVIKYHKDSRLAPPRLSTDRAREKCASARSALARSMAQGVSPLTAEELDSSSGPMADESAGLDLPEGQEPRQLRVPTSPTPEMIEKHELTHIPFRPWCRACVRGRGRADQHRIKSEHSSTVPLVSMDYMFLGPPGQVADRATGSDKLPILVVRDRWTRNIWAYACPSKGTEHPYSGKAVLGALNKFGYRKMILKTDQEPAIKKLAQEIKNGCPSEIILENSQKYVSQSNGEAERAVQSVQGMIRTLKEHVEYKAQMKIPSTHPSLAWLVEYAAILMNLYQIGEDGLTPYQRRRGDRWNAALPQFAEKVKYLRKTNQKVEPRFQSGVYIGVRETSHEKIIAASDGKCYVVGTVRRRPVEDRWDKEAILAIRGLPWKPCPEGANTTELPFPIEIVPIQDVEVDTEPATRGPDLKPRAKYLTKAHFEIAGYTSGCPACDELKDGNSAHGRQHTKFCRDRVEEMIKLDREVAEEQRTKAARTAQQPASSSSSAHPTSIAVHPGSQTQEEMNRQIDAEMDDMMQDPPVTGGSSSSGINPPRSTKRTMTQAELPGEEGKETDADNAEVVHLLMSIREPYLASLPPDPYPTCEERPNWLESILAEFQSVEYYDNISGKALDTKLVIEARKLEIETIDKMKVWEVVDRPRDPSKTIIGTRWVDVNKADDENPFIRSRLVAKEIKKRSEITDENLGFEYFAAMPPLAALKLLLCFCVTSTLVGVDDKVLRRRAPYCMSFVDVKRAHFVSNATRELYVELPAEAGVPKGKVGRLLKSMYGCRDAGKNWELEVARVMKKLGFRQGVSNPCVFYHAERDIRTMVHGDDFVSVASLEALKWLNKGYESAWTVVIRGIIGPPQYKECQPSIIVLNRLLTWTPRGIEYECDPRHAQLVLKDYGIAKGKVTTPIVKEPPDDKDKPDPKIPADEISFYRSATMRLNYAGQDRPDLAYVCRELAKGMSEPTERHVTMLKRCARYLALRPRVVQLFKWQDFPGTMHTWVDSNHAGCIRTRKSTTGVVTMFGDNCIRARCKGQGVIALSSGESEYYGLTIGMSEALGDFSLCADFNVKVTPQCLLDATTAISIGSRRGLGNVKHIDTVFLWVQEIVGSNRVRLGKRGTNDMLADMLTKPVAADILHRHMTSMGFRFEEGSHELAFKA